MPNIKQNLGVLRNGAQKKRSKTEDLEQVEETTPERMPTRDHWVRLETFNQRQFLKRKREHFIPPDMMRQAETADRNTPLGILDTIAREFITHWMPEIELFLTEDAYDDDDVERQAYKKLANGLHENVVLVVSRVDASQDTVAKTLAAALQNCAQKYLARIYEACVEVLSDKEKQKYHSNEQRSYAKDKEHIIEVEQKQPAGILTDARILDSTMAWSFAGFGWSHSPKKRRLLQTRFANDPDPADNGQIWDSPQIEMKRHISEIRNTSKMLLPAVQSQIEDAEEAEEADETEPAGKGDSKQVIDLVSNQDKSSDWMQYEQDDVMEDRSREEKSKLHVPGAFV